jgi:hypothetical protein
VSRAKKSIVEAFSRAYSSASPDEKAALRVWMRNIIRPTVYYIEYRVRRLREKGKTEDVQQK